MSASEREAMDEQFVNEAIALTKDRRTKGWPQEGPRQWRIGFAREVAMEALRLKSDYERYQA